MASLLVALVVLLAANDWLLRSAMRANSISRVNWLFQAEPESYDVAILGSSLAKEGVDPEQLSELLGVNVVQLAWGGRGVAEQALYWDLFLQRHACSTLLLELHPRGLEPGAFPHPLDQFRYFHRLEEPTIQRHLSRHYGAGRIWLWRWIPMLGLAEFNTQIGWHDLLALRHGEKFNPNAMGRANVTCTATQLAQQRLAAGDPVDPMTDERSVEQFLEILARCREKGVRVVAFYPPQFGGMDEADEQSLSQYRQLIDQNFPNLNVTYFVSRNADYAEQPAYYQDAFHLNGEGSRIFTHDLAEFQIHPSDAILR